MSNGRFFKAWKSYTYITSKKGCVHPINEKHACIVLNAKEDLMTYKAGIISQFLNSSALFAYNCRYNSHLNKLLNAENLFLFFFFWLSWRKGLKTLQSLLLDRGPLDISSKNCDTFASLKLLKLQKALNLKKQLAEELENKSHGNGDKQKEADQDGWGFER